MSSYVDLLAFRSGKDEKEGWKEIRTEGGEKG